jgi:hypothetical protein
MTTLLLALCLAQQKPPAPQNPPAPAPNDDLPPAQKDVDRAIANGAGFLLGRLPGSYGEVSTHRDYGLTYDGIVLYTLLHAGISKDDAKLRMLAGRCVMAKVDRTYTAATLAMGLGAMNDPKYKDKIIECMQFLVDNQCRNGQWSYGTPYEIPKAPPQKDTGGTVARIRVSRSGRLPLQPPGDNSNSQYAALGIHSAWRAGVDIDRTVLETAIEWWRGSQHGDGSWCYADLGKKGPDGFGSMAAGGASSLIMLNRVKGSSSKSDAKRTIDWLAENFSVTDNPKGPPDRQRFQYYYLYALERLGDLYPTEKMGKHLWYARGANWLLRNQKGGGSWCGPGFADETADTCFAILFLDRPFKVASEVKPLDK